MAAHQGKREECKHPFVWPDGDCVACGVLATTMPGHTEPHHTMVPRKFEPLISATYLRGHQDGGKAGRKAGIEEAAVVAEKCAMAKNDGEVTQQIIAAEIRRLAE